MTPLSLNLLSFNIRCNSPGDGPNAWPHRAEFAASVLADHQIDLAGLQEGDIRQIEELQSHLPDHAWIGAGRDDGQRGGDFAPIFYDRRKFTAEKHGDFWLSETPEVPGSKGWDASFPRVVTWGIFRHSATGSRVFFINTHLDHRGEQARRNSPRLLIRQIVRLHEGLPVILTGDFNSPPDSSVVRMLVGNPDFLLTDARQVTATPHEGGDQSFNDFRADGADLVIDFIFVGPEIRVQNHAYHRKIMDGIFVSDHWPVTSRVLLAGKP